MKYIYPINSVNHVCTLIFYFQQSINFIIISGDADVLQYCFRYDQTQTTK